MVVISPCIKAMGEAESEVNHVSNTSKIVTSGRLLYCQPEMVRPLTYLADKATKNTCV